MATPLAIRTTAASSPSPSPTRSSPGPRGADSPIRPETTVSSSPGGILQAQPPPCAYSVSRRLWVDVTTPLLHDLRHPAVRGHGPQPRVIDGGVQVAGAPPG